MPTSITKKQRLTKSIEKDRIGAQARLKIGNNVETVHPNKLVFLYLNLGFVVRFCTFNNWLALF